MDSSTNYELINLRESTAPMMRYVEKPIVSTPILVDIIGIAATCVLGVLTYRLSSKIADRQFAQEESKSKETLHRERMELVFNFFDVVTTTTVYGAKDGDGAIIMNQLNAFSQMYLIRKHLLSASSRSYISKFLHLSELLCLTMNDLSSDTLAREEISILDISKKSLLKLLKDIELNMDKEFAQYDILH